MQRMQEMKVFIEGMVKYPKAADTAPFATDKDSHDQTSLLQPSDAQARLKVSVTESTQDREESMNSSILACKHSLWSTKYNV